MVDHVTLKSPNLLQQPNVWWRFQNSLQSQTLCLCERLHDRVSKDSFVNRASAARFNRNTFLFGTKGDETFKTESIVQHHHHLSLFITQRHSALNTRFGIMMEIMILKLVCLRFLLLGQSGGWRSSRSDVDRWPIRQTRTRKFSVMPRQHKMTLWFLLKHVRFEYHIIPDGQVSPGLTQWLGLGVSTTFPYTLLGLSHFEDDISNG